MGISSGYCDVCGGHLVETTTHGMRIRRWHCEDCDDVVEDEADSSGESVRVYREDDS